MSFLEFLTAAKYWKQSKMILEDTSMTVMMFAAAEKPSMMQARHRVGTAVMYLYVHCDIS